jgi:hypothetical protein
MCLSGYTFPHFWTHLLQIWREPSTGHDTFRGLYIYVLCARNVRARACVLSSRTCVYLLIFAHACTRARTHTRAHARAQWSYLGLSKVCLCVCVSVCLCVFKSLPLSTHQDETLTFQHNLFWLELDTFFFKTDFRSHFLFRKLQNTCIRHNFFMFQASLFALAYMFLRPSYKNYIS